MVVQVNSFLFRVESAQTQKFKLLINLIGFIVFVRNHCAFCTTPSVQLRTAFHVNIRCVVFCEYNVVSKCFEFQVGRCENSKGVIGFAQQRVHDTG
jgi:hypothetical protein